MTIDSRYAIAQYNADGEVVYRFFTESIGDTAMDIYAVDPAGIRFQLTNPTHYSIEYDLSQTPTFIGGTVTLVTPLQDGWKLSVERKTPIVNDLVITSLERFPAEEFEYMMDKICFIQQEIEGHFCDCRTTNCIPVYITQEPTDQESGSGTVTFTVAADGTDPITYQWQQDNAGDGVFADMVGETNASLTVADTSSNQYRVVVTNPCGTATSVIVQVTGVPPTLVCESYDVAVLGGTNVASYTFTDEPYPGPGVWQLIPDRTGNERDANEQVQQGPFMQAETNIVWCNTDNYFRGADNTDTYRVYGKGGTESSNQYDTDPAWVLGMDDVTVHGFFKAPNLVQGTSDGTLIAFNGTSFRYSLDVRMRPILPDGEPVQGDKITLQWIGGQGGNQPEFWQPERIAGLEFPTDKIFWFGIYIGRKGSSTNTDMDIEVYFSDLTPGSTFQRLYSDTGINLTTLYHFAEQANSGQNLVCRIQIGEDATINGEPELVYGQRLAVEWGPLSDARLLELTNAFDANRVP